MGAGYQADGPTHAPQVTRSRTPNSLTSHADRPAHTPPPPPRPNSFASRADRPTHAPPTHSRQMQTDPLTHTQLIHATCRPTHSRTHNSFTSHADRPTHAPTVTTRNHGQPRPWPRNEPWSTRDEGKLMFQAPS